MARTRKAQIEAQVTEALVSIPKARKRIAALVAAGQEKAQQETEQPELQIEPATAEMVPLDEQLTEAEEETGRRLVEGEVLPWSAWAEPTGVTEKLESLRVQSSPEGMLLGGPNGVIGTLAREGLLQMGYVAGFPADFLPKLTPATAALVVNERLAASGQKEATALSEGGQITCFITSRREMLPAAEVAQLAWEALQPVGGVTVDFERFQNGRMDLRLLTQVEAPITRRKGDILGMGTIIQQISGEPISISLYARRLVCLNGMTANRQERSWRMAEHCTRDAQRAWVTETLNSLRGGFEELVERARVMAATPIQGDPEHVLLGAARAMRLPRRFHNALLEAFHEEPGTDYWTLQQSFTRLGTHGDLPENLRGNLLNSAGEWVRRFELVHCELPLPTAVSVGARIIHEG